jgi:MFS family permease
MLTVLRDSWLLLAGFTLIMLGNGLQATLLGVRGAIEGMSAATLSWVISGFFLGLLIGARATPRLIRDVGHVRVFAGLASLISAAFVLYGALPDPWVWAALRFVAGFAFCGIYVVTESWLNDRATNETRGQALSLYMVVQMVGVIAAQGLMVLGDPAGIGLFVTMSVMVSLAVVPILLTAAPAPAFRTAKPMSLLALFRTSPLGCVATFLLGGVFSAMFGMGAVWGGLAGLSVAQISLFMAMIYLGGLVFQYPIGWLSDRMDRRRLIVAVCAMGLAASLVAAISGGWGAILAAPFIGGAVNPLYSLAIAHTNDFLSQEDMPAASGGMLFLNGVGAVGGPLAVGAMMETAGAFAFFLYIGGLLALILLYALWRMTRRPSGRSAPFAAILPGATPVAVEVTREAAFEREAEARAEHLSESRGPRREVA